jgi:hypothetical protein
MATVSMVLKVMVQKVMALKELVTKMELVIRTAQVATELVLAVTELAVMARIQPS